MWRLRIGSGVIPQIQRIIIFALFLEQFCTPSSLYGRRDWWHVVENPHWFQVAILVSSLASSVWVVLLAYHWSFSPNSRALLPTFCTNCPDGSHFAKMGPPPNTVLYSAVTQPYCQWGYLQTQNTPKPTQNTPFLAWSSPELESKQFGPQLRKMFWKVVPRNGQK